MSSRVTINHCTNVMEFYSSLFWLRYFVISIFDDCGEVKLVFFSGNHMTCSCICDVNLKCCPFEERVFRASHLICDLWFKGIFWFQKVIFKVVFFWIQHNLWPHESSHSEYWLSGSFVNSDKIQLNINQVINIMILFCVI